MTLGEQIANLIRINRDSLGWSQEDLAQEIGGHGPSISKYESGTHSGMKLDTLERIAAAFGLKVEIRFVRDRKKG